MDKMDQSTGGTLGNETADTAGKNSLLLEKRTHIAYPMSTLNGYLNKIILEKWQREWGDSEKGRITHDIIPEVKNKMPFTYKHLVFFVTGKGSFPTFLKKILKKDDSCECGLQGSPLHYLVQKCKISPEYIKMKPVESLYNYFKRIDKNDLYRQRVKRIYEALNEKYSFIKRVKSN